MHIATGSYSLSGISYISCDARYATGQFQPPIDASSQVTQTMVVNNDGMMRMQFMRPIISDDTQVIINSHPQSISAIIPVIQLTEIAFQACLMYPMVGFPKLQMIRFTPILSLCRKTFMAFCFSYRKNFRSIAKIYMNTTKVFTLVMQPLAIC